MNTSLTPRPPLDDIALELCALSKVYPLKRGLFQAPGELKAVDDVSLRLYRGETLGLVGESGCGKSTLAKMLLGLLAPTSGNVLINGQEVDPTERRAHARHIQPIFQDPYSSLNPRKTVGEIVGLPLKLHGIGNAAERNRQVRQILDLVGMPERTHTQYPNQLSGGQRQRVAIARALILRPDILICDEPTSALDVSVQAQILNLLLDLKAEFGLTYLFISHDLGVVEHLVDRVAVMNKGSIVELASREQLFSDPQHPYTRMLLASALTPDPGLGIPALAAAA
ncbi:ATP-binding cassette domain-containing protein [Herbaspirillum huttiense]|uniref:ATP-binding cassette domain-containing protein n=1 Tax=Herbaspirillum TaxID=963 RepID=UPI000C090555|nr:MULTISPECIES: ATP-binding cassette domain-containing protein [Herbaspirillum]MAF05609.1 peptide ABC transporter ATP-binding protein [Herbaspirillum sp.]MBN9359645.1 ABC transporter ATP-binding protein [Herbaspirillum huttiense]MBO17801.1 peptide ABC transporter ATP-binding protein [Herbaspirillum sp.]MCO4855174.1 ATP-binding cassette domain-containing protein [Herbaspirillum sp. WGmk3]|tara:strand:- start:3739 stop:4584 length:846 start_codon:yes stop_codon:yes gene_type:complete